MNEKKGASSKKRKTLSAILAVAMILTMLLSGTLAYFYQSKAINLFTGDGYKKVIGHDDFDDMTYKKGGKTNKDVYVENVGETAVWVRIKLEEGLEKDGKVIQSLTSPTIHKLNNTGEEIDTTPAEGLGSENVGSTSHQEVFHGENGFKWTMGSADKTPVLLAQDDQIAKMEDKDNGIYIDKSDGAEVAHDDYGKGKATEGKELLDAPACSVISMAEYNKMKRYPEDANPTETTGLTYPTMAQTDYIGWVGDSAGWFYWSQMLKPGQVTGLLLNSVQVLNSDTEYKYNIHVTFEAVDETDRNLWVPRRYTSEQEDEYGNKVVAEQATTDAWALMDNALYKQTGEKTGAAALEELCDQALTAKKYGAAKAYDMAAKKLAGTAYRDYYPDVDELKTIGNNLMSDTDQTVIAIFADKKKTSENLLNKMDAPGKNFFPTLTETGIAEEDKDALARTITMQYGSQKMVDDSGNIVDSGGTERWVLTKDELKAMSTLIVDDYGTIQDYSALTATVCPNLSGLLIGRSQIFSASTEADGTGIKQFNTFDAEDSILPQIENLDFSLFPKRSSADLTRINLTQFTGLKYLSFANSSAFEYVTVPTSLTALTTIYSSVKEIKTNVGTGEVAGGCNVMNLPDLQYIVTGSDFSSYEGFDQLTDLRYVDLGNRGTVPIEIEEFDLSKSQNLGLLSLSPAVFGKCKLKVAETAFEKEDIKTESFLTNGWRFGFYPLGYIYLANETLSRVDVSGFSAKFSVLTLGTNMSSLKTVVRRSDQHQFTDYPTGTVVYEKVVDKNGDPIAYYKHEGTKTSEEKDATNFNAADELAKNGNVFPVTP